MRASAAALSVALGLTLAPVAAAAPAVEVERACYAEGDAIGVAGTGFAPNRPVELTLEKAGRVLETDTRPVSRPDGTVAGDYAVSKETGWFGPTQTRFDMTLRLRDRSAGESAVATFIFSRWNVAVRTRGGRLHPRRPARIRAVGYTNARGKQLYAHWIRNGKRVHTRRLGRLRGPCGNRRARLSRGFPFRPVRAGSYEVTFNSSRTKARARDSIVHPTARVRRRIP